MATVEIPYSYTVHGKYPRMSRVEKCTFSANVLLSVTEINSHSAPVVASCTYDDYRISHNNDGELAWFPSQFQTDYRVVDGNLLRRAVVDCEFLAGGNNRDCDLLYLPEIAQRAEILSCKSFVDSLDTVHLVLDIMRQYSTQMSGVHTLDMPKIGSSCLFNKVDFLGQHGFDCVTVDNQQEMQTDTQNKLSGKIFLVDNNLYVPSSGPAWIEKINNDNHSVLYAKPELGWLKRNEYSNMDLSKIYLPEDPLIDMATERSQGSQRTKGSIEILNSGSWRVDLDEFFTRSIATEMIVGKLAQTLFDTGSAAGLHRIADIKALMDTKESCAPALIAALDDFADEWDRTFGNHTESSWLSFKLRKPGLRVALRNKFKTAKNSCSV